MDHDNIEVSDAGAQRLARLAEGLTDDQVDALLGAAEARQDGSISRREFAKAAGALGVGSLLGGGGVGAMTETAAADASTTDGDWTVGSPSNRGDVFADGVNATSVNTDEGQIDKRLIRNQDSGYQKVQGSKYSTSGSGVPGDTYNDGLQAAVDDLVSNDPKVGSGLNLQSKAVVVDGKWADDVDLTHQGLKLVAPTPQGFFKSDSDHTVDVQAFDCILEKLTIRNDSGSSHDCVFADFQNNKAGELYMQEVSMMGDCRNGLNATAGVDIIWIDNCDAQSMNATYGYNLDDCSDIYMQNSEAVGTGVRLGQFVTRVNISNLTVKDAPQDSLYIESNPLGDVGQPNIDIISENCTRDGVRFDSARDVSVSGVVSGSGNNGVFFNNATDCKFNGRVYGSTNGYDLNFSNASGCVAVGRFGDVYVDSNTSNCKVVGVWDSKTDNGTGNTFV